MANQWGREDYIRYTQSPEWKALADTLSYAEGTNGANGYFTQFGGGKFTSKNGEHPDTVIDGGKYKSAAAGRYQFMPRTWSGASTALGGLDIRKPGDQDAAAAYLARNRLMQLGGLSALQKGFTAQVSDALSPEWASLPTKAGVSYYGQPVKKFDDLQAKYNEALKKYQSGSQLDNTQLAQATAPTSEATAPQTATTPIISGNDDGTKSVSVPGGVTVNIGFNSGNEKEKKTAVDLIRENLLASTLKSVSGGLDVSQLANVKLYPSIDDLLA